MQTADLPTRRTEAWKYSDLRGALADAPVALRDGRDVIERLAPQTIQHLVDPGTQTCVVERLDKSTLDARAADFDVGAGATLTRVVIQTGLGVPLSMARVRLGAGARLRQIILAEGAQLARIETHVTVEGEDAQVELNGVYTCGSGRHADLTSVIEHKAPGGRTRQLIKGVAARGGRGVFQGKIVVAREAQKTDARQHHQGMLLEEGAEILAKPELMIHADDVQCAHGNTAGGLDERGLFYLRARGIPEREARALLIEAFLLEALPEGLPPEIDSELRDRVSAWLGGAA